MPLTERTSVEPLEQAAPRFMCRYCTVGKTTDVRKRCGTCKPPDVVHGTGWKRCKHPTIISVFMDEGCPGLTKKEVCTLQDQHMDATRDGVVWVSAHKGRYRHGLPTGRAVVVCTANIVAPVAGMDIMELPKCRICVQYMPSLKDIP